MSAAPIRLLLLEDDPVDARLVGHMLRRQGGSDFQVEVVNRLAHAVERLARDSGDIDVVMADLNLPDAAGLKTLTTLLAAAPRLPVVVLTGNDNEELALDALKHGAQDYVVKGSGDGFLLSRVIRYAVERKAGELALKEARDRAEQAGRAKSLFLAMVGHEIRTPLNGILGMAQLLLDSPMDYRQRTYVETLASSGELLLGLVNDILDFARLDAEGLSLASQPFDVLPVIEDVRLLLASRAAEKGLLLTCRFSPEVEPVVLGDPLRLRQILFNLVGNAIKFTDKGSVAVEVSRLPDGEGGQRLRFTVADTGIGIPESARINLFTEFWQAEDSGTRRYGGAGLGLAICRRLIALMGGTIDYDSRPGEGSVFRFDLPLPVTDEPVADLLPTLARPTTRRRVLLVDDNHVNRAVAAGLLERRGHEVVSVESGAEAVEVVTAGAFDLALIDLNMPDMDGVETAEALRTLPHGASLPMYLLTANPTLADEARWRAAGLSGCLGKPFRVEEAEALLSAEHGGGGGLTATTAPGEPPLLTLPELLADLKDLGRERMVALTDLFRQSSASDLTKVMECAAAENAEDMARHAHRLASAALSVHLSTLGERCRAIETAVKAGRDNPCAMADGLEELWNRSVAALASVLDAP